MLYKWKILLLKNPRVNFFWRYWRAWRGAHIGNYWDIPHYVRRYAGGKTFADIGCMWGVNGQYSFLAEEAGAIAVKAVDVFGPTPEFEATKQARSSRVEFILGDITQSATRAHVRTSDVVLCAGVLYHHPSPFDVLVALRSICREVLILRTFTIPEMGGLPNAAVYFPVLPEAGRNLWNLQRLGLRNQVGITDGFQPDQGYGNWFWGLTPSCVASLLQTAGFQIDDRAEEAFAHTFICSPVALPFGHDLPTYPDARDLGLMVSRAGVAWPA
jgi:hypothetical protein